MSRKTLKPIALVCGSLLAATLVGCGGGGGGTSHSGNTGGAPAPAAQGQVKLHIIWPAKVTGAAAPRYIPAYAASLFFELSPKGNPSQTYTLTVNRPSNAPSTQDVTFTQLLSSGTYELSGVARALADAQGATVASGGVEINVQPGINPVPLTLNSTVKTLLVLGQPISVGVGQTLTLQSGAFDPDGNGLLLPTGALTWSIVSGSQFGTITPAGVLTATKAGTVRVHVAEPVTGVFAEANVTVTGQTSTTGLAASGYPRASADLGNTGLVSGTGATGQVAWTFNLGNRAASTPVLGNNNDLFVVNQDGAVFSLNATTGVKNWKMTLPNTTANTVSGASIMVSSDNTVYVGTSAGVVAYDAGTGLQKWDNVDYGDESFTDMTLDSGKVYVPTANLGMGIIDAASGATLPPLPAFSTGNTITHTPAIDNGTIYYVSENYPQNRGAALFAISLATGATLWSSPITGATGSGFLGTDPVVKSGTVYVVENDGTLNGLDAQTGAVKYTQSMVTSTGTERPVIGQDGSVYFVQHDSTVPPLYNYVVKYSATLSQKSWTSTNTLSQLTVGGDGTVYGTAPDTTPGSGTTPTSDTSLFALNPADGSVKWKVPLNMGLSFSGFDSGSTFGYISVGPSGMVYVGSIDNLVYAIK